MSSMMELVAILPPKAQFFAGFLLILILYGGSWAFTYWISKEE